MSGLTRENKESIGLNKSLAEGTLIPHTILKSYSPSKSYLRIFLSAWLGCQVVNFSSSCCSVLIELSFPHLLHLFIIRWRSHDIISLNNNQQIRVFWTFVSTILFFAGSSTPNTWKYQVRPRYSESSSPLTSATVSSLAFFPRLTKAHFPCKAGVRKGGKRASWKTFAWEACSAHGSSSGSQPSSSFLRSEPSMIRAQKTQGPPQIKWC